MNKIKNQPGFTMIELFVVLGVLAIMLAAGLSAFNSIRGSIALKNQCQEIAGALRLAQNQAIVSYGRLSHGVHFNADSYVVYSGDWLTAADKYVHTLTPGISITSGGDISFARLTGQTGDASIVLETPTGSKKTIEVTKTGSVMVK